MSKQFFNRKAALHTIPSVFIHFLVFNNKFVPIHLVFEKVNVDALLDAGFAPFKRLFMVSVGQTSVFFRYRNLHITQISSCSVHTTPRERENAVCLIPKTSGCQICCPY